jgi:uncharacterized protein (TIGR02599 family)
MIVAFCERHPRCRCKRADGFSLVEMLVSVAILGVIMAIILSMVQQTGSLWKNTSGKIEGFRNARAAFDAMTRTISQATLETYFDYQDSSNNWAGSTAYTSPSKYVRRSDLHFISGQGGGSTNPLLAASFSNNSATYTPVTHAIFFQAPLGYSTLYPTQQRLLNACGFYVAYGPDPNVPSYLSSLSPRYRYRLMEFLQPAESLQVYMTTAGATESTWFTNSITGTYTTSANYVLAENVVALVVWPKPGAGDLATGTTGTLTTNYSYDSRSSTGTLTYNQLPPIVQVTMVVIDETSAIHLGNSAAPPALTAGAPFTDVTKYTTDMGTLEANLMATAGNSAGNHIPLNYRVYQTEVAISGAKWSGVQ